ncbi:unnamed protein product, partial [Thlaspi arvense]
MSDDKEKLLKKMTPTDFAQDKALLYRICCFNWIPTENPGYPRPDRVKMVFKVCNGIPIDFGKLVFDQVVYQSRLGNRKWNLVFPSLIYQLLLREAPIVQDAEISLTPILTYKRVATLVSVKQEATQTIKKERGRSEAPTVRAAGSKTITRSKGRSKEVSMFLILNTILALFISFAKAYDPSPLQDFCVAIDDPKNGVFVNGKFCKDPKQAKAEDFFFSGLNKAGNTDNDVKSNVTTVNVDQIPGLNTMGISLVRIDYAPYGQNPPHTHPRATEILVLQEGTLYIGFVSSNQDNNHLFAKVLQPGDVNIGKTRAVAFAGLSSQNAGVIRIADTVFGSMPQVNPDVLAMAFQLDVNVVKDLEAKFKN